MDMNNMLALGIFIGMLLMLAWLLWSGAPT